VGSKVMFAIRLIVVVGIGVLGRQQASSFRFGDVLSTSIVLHEDVCVLDW